MVNPTQSIDTIFCSAIDIDSADQRRDYVDQACGDDVELRRQVDRLLRAHFGAGDFLGSPAVTVAPTVDQPIAEKPGAQIGPYKLLQTIGEGGMGVVYMAEQKQPVKRRVALKIIKPGMDTSQVIARFEAERQALALMDHPNIAKVLDAGTTDSGRPYFVMELVSGLKITDYCDDQHLTPKERLALFIPICQAVQHAHQKGIIHRDLKPSNILVAQYDGQPVPKVIDFGVAKATSQTLTEKTLFTQLGQIVGTLEYMSPEQAERHQLDIDTRSDVYSLGVVLYELLTGTTPFEGSRLRGAAFDEMLRIIREEEPPRPSFRLSSIETLPSLAANRRVEPRRLTTLVRGELDWIVMKALEKDRGRRYETATGFAADIQRYLDDDPVVACPPSAAYRLRKFARRHRAILGTATIVGAALLIGLVGTSSQWWRAESALIREGKERRQAERQRDRATKEYNISTVRRLAAESRAVLHEFPLQSLLLGIEAVKFSSRRLRMVMPVAHETVLNTTHVVGGRPLVGQAGAIHSVAISSDNRRLVTGGKGTARVWDITAEATVRSSRVLRGHSGVIYAVALSPNGRWVVTAGGQSKAFGEVWLWDLTIADPNSFPIELPGHRDRVWSVSISNDNHWLATGGEDGVVRLWDLTAKDPSSSLTKLGEHEGKIYSTDISPDSRWLATGSEDRTAQLWDLTAVDSPTSPIVLRGHKQGVACRFSPDGKWLGTRSWDGTARLWDLTSVHTDVRSVVLQHEDKVEAIAFSPNGRWLVTGCWDKTARLWALDEQGPADRPLELRGHEEIVWKLGFSPDSRWLATATRGRRARLWDLDADDPTDTPIVLRGHDNVITDVAVSQDGQWLVTASWDGTARLWDLVQSPSSSPLILQGHRDRITRVAITPNRQRLVTASYDTTARVWDLSDKTPSSPTRVLPDIGRAEQGALAISPNGQWLATGSNDATAKLWRLNADGITSFPATLRGHQAPVIALAISANSRWLATGSEDSTARVWDLGVDPPVSKFVLKGNGDVVWLVAISPDGRWVITNSGDKTAAHADTFNKTPRLWDLHAPDPSASPVLLHGHERAVRSVAMSPDGRWAFTGSVDRTARLWDLRAANPAADSVEFEDHWPWWSVLFSPNSRWLQTGPRIWDLEAENITSSHRELRGHTGIISSSAVSANSRWLVTGSGDNTARVWDLATQDPSSSSIVLRGHSSRISCVAISPDGRWVATGSHDNTARLWDLNIDSLLDLAHNLVGRDLTEAERQRYSLDVSDGQLASTPGSR